MQRGEARRGEEKKRMKYTRREIKGEEGYKRRGA